MDILIIGAGAAGLMAARELTKNGQQVCILEARDRIGGRIHTINNDIAGIAYEAGAEFIHGKLPVTLELLNEAGLEHTVCAGNFYHVTNGKWKQAIAFVENEEQVIERLAALKANISVKEFLDQEFPGEEHKTVRESLTSYIEGYYSGDPAITSALSFYKEWQSEDEEQSRPKSGYGAMIENLREEFIKAGGLIQLSTIVKEIRWQKDYVRVIDESTHSYIARKVIVTVPLGVWTATEGEKGAITYCPALMEKQEAAKKMGFGSVLKIVMQFKRVFWEDERFTKNNIEKTKDFSFVFANAPIDTWWSQLPEHVPVLTGWVAGPKAIAFNNLDDYTLIDKSIESLSIIFNIDQENIREQLHSYEVFNWTTDPFTRGSYAYSTTETEEARNILMEPVENTLFFAGEALYDGHEMGTVEAALISGKRVAKEILDTL